MSRLVDNKPCKLPDGPANNQNMMTIKKKANIQSHRAPLYVHREPGAIFKGK